MTDFNSCVNCGYYHKGKNICTFDCLKCKHWDTDFFDYPCSRCRSINIEDKSLKCLVDLITEDNNG